MPTLVSLPKPSGGWPEAGWDFCAVRKHPSRKARSHLDAFDPHPSRYAIHLPDGREGNSDEIGKRFR
jgi:hypothetical protein